MSFSDKEQASLLFFINVAVSVCAQCYSAVKQTKFLCSIQPGDVTSTLCDTRTKGIYANIVIFMSLAVP